VKERPRVEMAKKWDYENLGTTQEEKSIDLGNT
jgi:hypothetical protein